ncbi:MAG: hypothetical protein S0880_22270 [Actinomycetota bacterium]|nr:hypothetical protein [Actinomycetota bacterium]
MNVLTRLSALQRRALLLAVAVVGALVLQSWLPFDAELPLFRRTEPVRTTNGTIVLDGRAVLESDDAPDWLRGARSGGEIHVDLEVRPSTWRQGGPARILTVSDGTRRSDLMIGQNETDLVVRLRHPGSDDNGEPGWSVRGALTPDVWHTVSLTVLRGDLTVTVDGERVIDEDLGSHLPLAGWDPGYTVALGDEPVGERGWSGEIRRAVVSSPSGTSNLLGTGELDPGTGEIVRSRVRTFPTTSAGDPALITLARLLSFAPVGAAAHLLWRRWRRTGLAVVVVATGLTAGKLFIAGRHPLLADVLVGVVGGFCGALAAALWIRWRRTHAHARI